MGSVDRIFSDIETVVFDFDGTLVLSNDIKRNTFYDVVAGISGGAAALDAVFGGPHGDRYDVFAQFVGRISNGDAVLARNLADRYTALCDERIAVAPEVPGALETLVAFGARGMKSWIASATPEAPLVASIRRRNLFDHFSGVFGLPTTKIEALSDVMARTGFGPDQVLMVGDAEADRAAAASVGARFIGVAGGTGGFRSSPALMLDDLRELPGILSRA